MPFPSPALGWRLSAVEHVVVVEQRVRQVVQLAGLVVGEALGLALGSVREDWDAARARWRVEGRYARPDLRFLLALRDRARGTLALLLFARAVALRLGPLRLALPLGRDQLESGRPLAGAADALAVDVELTGDRPVGGTLELRGCSP